MHLIKIILIPTILGLVISSCSQPTDLLITNTDTMTITVSVLPQKYFVERIGGEHVNVNVMVGPGDSPHSYEPKASQMTALSNSSVYFKIGVEFENAWMDRISSANPNMLIIDLSENITKLEAIRHNHTSELDPHIWTSPANGRLIAIKVNEILTELDLENSKEYDANLELLLLDIELLQEEINTSLSSFDSHKFMVFHPAWGYFANEFSLEQIPIEIAGTEPSARELSDLITKAKHESIQIIFVQPEFSTRSAEYIATEINGQVIMISPLAEDWLENLHKVAQTLAEVL